MPYPNEHAARLENPDKYEKIRRENDYFYLEGGKKEDEGIDVIWGIRYDKKEKKDVTQIQALRFRTEFFTVQQAKNWLKEHPEFKVILFEEAEKEKPDKEAKKIHIKGEKKMSIEDKDKDKNKEKVESEALTNKDNTEQASKIVVKLKDKAKDETELVKKVLPYINNSNYSPGIHKLAQQVLTGESTYAELQAAVGAADEIMAAQKQATAAHETGKLPETPPDPNASDGAISQDGHLRTPQDVQAAIKKMRNLQ